MKNTSLSIQEIHQLYKEKKLTPYELTLQSLSYAKNDDNNAFEYISEKEALEIASNLKEFDESKPLWGIPFSIKDNYSTKDIPTTGSSNILNGYIPVYDSEVYKKLIAAGAIPIGKTTLDELAMGGSGVSGHLGKTFNPWDKKHLHQVGGSSCGSAACVANSITPFSIGSDTGDSVRKPASYAGLVGFKPTWGRISRYGLFPFAPSLDHVAYFTRNVYDSALILNVLAGRDDKDLTSSFEPVDNYTSEIGKDIKGVRIAVISEILDSISNQNIISAFKESLIDLEKSGATINYVHMNLDLLKAIYPAYIIISCSEATSNNANLDGIKFGPRPKGNTYQEVMTNARTQGFSELIKRRFVIGSYSLYRENQNDLYLNAKRARRLIVNAINDILNENDFIYVPASPTTAPLFNSSSDRLSDEYLIADNHLAIGNFAGLPSITLPISFENNLPFGANLTGRAFQESALFKVASVIEDNTGLKNLSVERVK